MATDLMIALFHHPGTLAAATATLGQAGVNIDGQCAYVCEGQGVYHLLVDQPVIAYRALIDAGFEILAERQVVMTEVEDRPGATGAVLRRIADSGANIDLAYLAADGRLVLGGPDVNAIARALGS